MLSINVSIIGGTISVVTPLEIINNRPHIIIIVEVAPNYRSGKPEFVPIDVWGKNAYFISNNARPGDTVAVKGKLIQIGPDTKQDPRLASGLRLIASSNGVSLLPSSYRNYQFHGIKKEEDRNDNPMIEEKNET